jgi:hypothetical protein
MPVFQHFQDVKKSQQLPMAEQVGACITCNWWNVETPRPEEETKMVGVCVQPQLQGYALIVSGASACNKWSDKLEAGEEAHRYAEHAEVQA